MTIDLIRRMAGNNLWANHRLHWAVCALRPGEFEAPRTGFFPSIRATLNHVLSVDLYYLDMMRGDGFGLKIFDVYVERTDPATLAEDQAKLDRDLVAFCEQISDADLGRSIPTDRGEAGTVPERLGDLLVHLFTHDIHHRGQVHAMLSGTSVGPPQLDEFFLDFDASRRGAEVERLGLGQASNAG